MPMRRILPLILFPLLAAAAAFATAPLYPHDIGSASFTVERGQSLRGVLHRAAAGDIVRTPKSTELVARVLGVDQPKAGTYRLPASASDLGIVRLFHAGRVATVAVTVPEGWTADDVAAALERAGVTGAGAFLAASRDRKLLQQYGIPATEAEGYLFPETYHFAQELPATAVVKPMLDTFFERLPDGFGEAASAVGLTPHEAVIMASIVQLESFDTAEMNEISGVFHNRLQRGMRLQADPTAIYRMPDYDGNLTKAHLQKRTPYNTYRISGLPAGPIGNPGVEALAAAVDPAPTDALYFVARPGGGHVFAEDYPTHQENVRRHQLLRRP